MWRKCLSGLVVVGCLLMANCGGDDAGGDSANVDGSGGTGGGGGGGSGGGGSGSGGVNPGTSSSSSGRAGEGGDAAEPCLGQVQFSFELANAICDKRAECCADDSHSDCLVEVLESLDFFPDLADAEASGSAELDCDALDTCVQAISAAACEDWPFQTSDNDQVGAVPVNEPACYSLVQPKLEADSPCKYNYECVNGLCVGASDEARGTCVEHSGLNGACGEDAGGSCDPASMFCNSGGMCQAYLPKGTSCTDHDQCETRLCDLEGTGTCIAPGADHCRYVPLSPAHCAIRFVSSGKDRPAALLVLMALGGLAMRRRRA